MKQTLLSIMMLWAAASPALAQDPSEAPAQQPTNPMVAQQKLIFVPDSLKPFDLNDDNARWCWRQGGKILPFLP